MGTLGYLMIRDHMEIDDESDEMGDEIKKIKEHARKMKRFRYGYDERATGLTPEKEKRFKQRREELLEQAR